MSDQPNDYPTMALRPDAAPTPDPPSVDGAFLAVDLALHAVGGVPGADIDRVTAFRKSTREVAQRWKDGRPAPVMRAKKPEAPAPSPQHSTEPEHIAQVES